MSEIIKGRISSYIYKSEDSLYKIARIISNNEEVIITGSFMDLEEGLEYEFVGEYVDHPKYGVQFKIESYTKTNSFTKEGLIAYFSSDKFHGIGTRLATNIVEILGEDCIEQILEDPDSLDVIPKLQPAKKDVIISVLKDNYATEAVYVKLFGFGLTPKMIHRLMEVYGLEAAIRVEKNPYSLLYDVEGFGFKKSDNLAMSIGFKENDFLRLKEAVRYTLNTVCYQQGYTFLTKDQLVNSAHLLLGSNPIISLEELVQALDDLVLAGFIIKEEERYFDSALYKAEVKCSERIKKLKNKQVSLYKPEKIKEVIKEVELDLDIRYTDLQKEAIIKALSNKLSIITGGPGTGKSTIINGIIRCYARLEDLVFPCDELDMKICMMAPTGRAAKRMNEISNFKARTIHKTLGYNYEGGFQYNEKSQLYASLYIIDESSMIDINLASTLLSALPSSSQVIFVGDENQLPSVGPGNVFHDFIASNLFETVKLHEIMRQAKDSNIIKLSNMVHNGRIDPRIFNEKRETYFYPCEAKSFKELLFRLVDSYLSTGKDLKEGMQILIPMYAGVVGIDEINKEMSNRYNKNEEMLVRNDIVIKVDDKVLQLKNDSILKIMNGDIGVVKGITKIKDKDTMHIDFDGMMVDYPAKEMENLKLAYAISIHKSQGSEYENVILPIFPSYFKMLRKKIIYTAITRAKKKLIMVGSMETLNQAITTLEPIRQTGLLNRLSDSKQSKIKILDPSIPFEYLGEYDMEGITPYSFME